MGTNNSPILYAAEPFDGSITGCYGAAGQGFPNGTDADNARGAHCTAIAGATAATYAARAADRGHRLRVRVTALDVAGSGTATSGATAHVPAKR
jgi:hypothetical protein